MELGWEHRTEEQTVYSFLLNLINIKRVDPRLRLTSSEIFQPSKFYVLFPYEIKKYDMFPYPMADRDEFLGLLKEWGVEIEGLETDAQ